MVEGNIERQMRMQLKWRLLNTELILRALRSGTEEGLRSVFTDAVLTDLNRKFLAELDASCDKLEVVAVHFCDRCRWLEVYFRVMSENTFWESNLLEFDVLIEDNGLMMIAGMAVHEIPETNPDIETASGGTLLPDILDGTKTEQYHEVKISLRVPCRTRTQKVDRNI